ncbi:MAG: hypothetical protein K2J20_03500, partial [Bacilli bacterium]|nr:hypothetical protein [Bacilli bacterium]
PWSDYNGLNHDRFLFEIDADIQGSKQCGMIMLSIGQNINEVEQEMLSLDEKEQKIINESRTIIINGVEVDKKDLFDSIILKKPEYVQKFPVFSIEYNDDGSKKTKDEILSTLESYRLNQMYTEEELSAIEICIFGDSIENKKSIK